MHVLFVSTRVVYPLGRLVEVEITPPAIVGMANMLIQCIIFTRVLNCLLNIQQIQERKEVDRDLVRTTATGLTKSPTLS